MVVHKSTVMLISFKMPSIGNADIKDKENQFKV